MDIPEGNYEILFTFKHNNPIEHYTFSFIESKNPTARVLKVDKELSLPEHLLMEAIPAI